MQTQAHLAKYGTALSAADWARSLARCPSVLSEAPSVLADRVAQLQTLMGVSEAVAGSTVAKAPSLLQHDPHEMALKVQALQAVMDLPAEEASAQLIIERFSRYPEILERSVDALEAQLSGLAELLGSDLQRAGECEAMRRRMRERVLWPAPARQPALFPLFGGAQP